MVVSLVIGLVVTLSPSSVEAFYDFGLSGATTCNDDGTWSVIWTIDADAVESNYGGHEFSVYDSGARYSAGWFAIDVELSSERETFGPGQDSASETVTLSLRPLGEPSDGYVAASETATVSKPAGCEPPTTLTLNKRVEGGLAESGDWSLSASGPTSLSGSSGVSGSVEPGSYVLSESEGPSGYELVSLTCSDAPGVEVTSVALELGDVVTCTFVNRSVVVPPDPVLTLEKVVAVGDVDPGVWGLSASGPTSLSGSSGVSGSVEPGSYVLSESEGPSGYEWESLTCSGKPGVSIDDPVVTLELGDVVTCTFVNRSVVVPPDPVLTLEKVVAVGDADPGVWGLSASGPTSLSGSSGVSGSVEPGSYVLSESEGPSGYEWESLTCSGKPGVSIDDPVVTLEPGDVVTCTFVNRSVVVPLDPVLTLEKVVAVGDVDPGVWGLSAVGPVTLSGDGFVSGVVPAGSYVLSESEGPSGYEWESLTCSGKPGVSIDDPVVTLEPGDVVTCTFVNRSVVVPLDPVLTLEKVVAVGDVDPGVWGLSAVGPVTLSGDGFVSGVVPAGSYVLSESEGPSGYELVSLTCSDAPGVEVTSVALELGDVVTCTFVNRSVVVPPDPVLTLEKVVAVGDVDPGVWGLSASGPTSLSGSSGVSGSVEPGSYVLSESEGPSGYEWESLTCSGKPGVSIDDPVVTLEPGDDVTCTFTNAADDATLSLSKIVVNDDGGDARYDQWELTAVGPTRMAGAGFVSDDVEPGDYVLSESGTTPETRGYRESRWYCEERGELPDGRITLEPGDTERCFITNNDIRPTLTLVKEVQNDDLGTASPQQWRLHAVGPTPISGFGKVTRAVVAGEYELSESDGPGGYTLTSLTCDNVAGQVTSVTLVPGANVTCTFENDDDDPARLTVVKEVDNAFGGDAQPNDWTLFVDGATARKGRGEIGNWHHPGTYTLSESRRPGYEFESLACRNANGPVVTKPKPVQEEQFEIALGAADNVTCTFVNKESERSRPRCVEPPCDGITGSTVELTLAKEVVGGQRSADEWTMIVRGPLDTPNGRTYEGPGSLSRTVPRGDYVLSEEGPDDYESGEWSCDGGTLSGNRITLDGTDDSVNCTITNTYIESGTIEIERVTSICSGEVPYVSFVMIGTVLADTDVVDVSLFDVEGNLARRAEVAIDRLDGWVLYPGASADPLDWPGQEQDAAGDWIEDPSDRLLADGGEFVVELNGVEVDSVAYPGVPDDCGGPTLVDVRVACPNGIPHVGYEIPGDAELATLTLTDLDGTAMDPIPAVPLTGVEPYPGASVDPRDWPGWRQNDEGDWVPDPTDERLADGGTMTVEIDGDVFDVVAYPAAPPCGPTDRPSSVTLSLVVDAPEADAGPDRWTLTAGGTGGNDFTQRGQGRTTSSTLRPDTFTLRADGPDDETAQVTCAGGVFGKGQLRLGDRESATCTLAVASRSSLTLDTRVQGGGEAPTGLVLSADGPTSMSVASGDSRDVRPGIYALSAGGAEGFTSGDWECVGGRSEDDRVTVSDDDVTCTLTLIPFPTLTLEKVIRGGGFAEDGVEPSDWTLRAEGSAPLPAGAGRTSAAVEPGTYVLFEDGPSESLFLDWTCDGERLSGNRVTVGVDDVTCVSTSRLTRPQVVAVLADNEADVCSGASTYLEYEVSLINEWSEPVRFELLLIGLPDELTRVRHEQPLTGMEGDLIDVDERGNPVVMARVELRPYGATSEIGTWTVRMELPDDRTDIGLFNVQLALDLLDADASMSELGVDRRNLFEPTTLASCDRAGPADDVDEQGYGSPIDGKATRRNDS